MHAVDAEHICTMNSHKVVTDDDNSIGISAILQPTPQSEVMDVNVNTSAISQPPPQSNKIAYKSIVSVDDELGPGLRKSLEDAIQDSDSDDNDNAPENLPFGFETCLNRNTLSHRAAMSIKDRMYAKRNPSGPGYIIEVTISDSDDDNNAASELVQDSKESRHNNARKLQKNVDTEVLDLSQRSQRQIESDGVYHQSQSANQSIDFVNMDDSRIVPIVSSRPQQFEPVLPICEGVHGSLDSRNVTDDVSIRIDTKEDTDNMESESELFACRHRIRKKSLPLSDSDDSDKDNDSNKHLDDSDNANINFIVNGENQVDDDGIRDRQSITHKFVVDNEDEFEYKKDVHIALRKSQRRKKIRRIYDSSEITLDTLQAERKQHEFDERAIARKQKNDSVAREPSLCGEMKRLFLDKDTETNRDVLEVAPALVGILKPHQIEGIQFMYNTTFESIDMIKNKNFPGGCILAHSMGLGKTLQIVAFVQTLFKYPDLTGIKRVLILCPLGIAENWKREFETWKGFDVSIHNIYEAKNYKQRICALETWREKGGVAILHYDLFRSLVNSDQEQEGTNLDQKGKDKLNEKEKTCEKIKTCLVNPGPDLVICDEGHVIKTKNSQRTLAVKKISTERRIILTGTPLQNNLSEYYTMVDFVKPHLLGTPEEFRNRFEHPITNGQHADSDEGDVKLMKERAYILHMLLKGFVHRVDYTVLASDLPSKNEFVILIKLSEEQKLLYQEYFKSVIRETGNAQGNTFSYFSSLVKICSHPYALTTEKDNLVPESGTSSNPSVKWWEAVATKEDLLNIVSGKLVVLEQILRECEEIGDRVLVFSQYLFNLDIIEAAFHKWDKVAKKQKSRKRGAFGRWRKDIDYLRIDGKVQPRSRQEVVDKFNTKSEGPKVLLISSKTGSLGMNICGANRVVIFDPNYNPSQDKQSVFRVYRIGQEKTCYIYRFVTSGTVEQIVLNRQVNKLSMSSRVVDEQENKRYLNKADTGNLFLCDYQEELEDSLDKEKSAECELIIQKDTLLQKIVPALTEWIVRIKEFESNSDNPLENEESLSEEEKKEIWAQFIRDHPVQT